MVRRAVRSAEHEAVIDETMIAERGDVADRLALVEAEIERRVGIRIDLALASPSEYLTRELGEQPDDPELGDRPSALWAEVQHNPRRSAELSTVVMECP